MIDSWTLEHFKSVYEKTTLDLAPLTVFAGVNSSGKSTLIQSFLLVAQTNQNSVKSRSVVLNGRIIKMGTFNDIMSNNPEKDDITIGFKITLEEGQQTSSFMSRNYYPPFFIPDIRTSGALAVVCEFKFSANRYKDTVERDALQLQPRLEECKVNISTNDPKDNNIELHFRRARSLQRKFNSLNLNPNQLQALDSQALEYELISKLVADEFSNIRSIPEKTIYKGVMLRHFLPERISIVFDIVDHQIKSFVELLENAHPYYYPFLFNSQFNVALPIDTSLVNVLHKTFIEVADELSRDSQKKKLTRIAEKLKGNSYLSIMQDYIKLSQSIRDLIAQKIRENKNEIEDVIKTPRQPEYRVTYSPLPELINFATDYIESYFSQSVKYLGPLRDDPKLVYPLLGSGDSRDIGLRGEHTASVLEIHRNTRINYIPPKSFELNSSTYTPIETTLAEAVLDWLEYMDIANDVKTEDKGKLGIELKVKTDTDYLHDLTHVGVGVSQVLPILVISLLSEPNSTLIFEQPELHLHPRVQSRLADFFVSMISLKKQCIVETHSEYLVNRLRLRAAISTGEHVSDNVMIYFVEKKSGRSKYTPIKMNRFGVLNDWPKGFFDESEELAALTLRASMEKRKTEKS